MHEYLSKRFSARTVGGLGECCHQGVLVSSMVDHPCSDVPLFHLLCVTSLPQTNMGVPHVGGEWQSLLCGFQDAVPGLLDLGHKELATATEASLTVAGIAAVP